MTEFSGPLSRALPTWRTAVRAPHGLDGPPGGTALPAPPATDRSAWRADRLDTVTVTDLLARVATDRGAPWPTPRARDLARLHRDGDRDAYEQIVFARQARLTRAVLAAATTGEECDLDEVADGVWSLCEQSTWCWPAHDDVGPRRGWVLPSAGDPYLDLGAGEVAGQLAWVDAVLGEALAARWPGLRERVRHEVAVRVLDPFLTRRDWHWIGLDGDVHNWNPWIHGNVLVSALVLAEPAVRADAVVLAVEGIDRYLAAMPADGAVDEGYAYWWNGACRAMEALQVLAHATDGVVDARELPLLRALVAFPARSHLGGEWFLNVADGPARPGDQPWHSLLRAGTWLGDADAVAFARARRDPARALTRDTDGLGRCVLALTDPRWRDAAAVPVAAPVDADVWWPSVQVRLARPRPGHRLTLAVKGGHNGEHHNHNDVGEVVVARDGVPVLVDAGRPTYTAATFGPDRYDTWCLRSEWHNVPAIAGLEQGVGERYAASDVVVHPRGLALDLTGAYPGVVGTWRRTAVLAEDGRAVVTDVWELPAGTPPTRYHLVLAGHVRADGHDGVVVTPVEGDGDVRIGWTLTDAVAKRPSPEPVLEEIALTDPMLGDVWGSALTRLTLALPGPTGTLTLVVREVEETS
ncbi:hypothetical protein C8046_08405 [Serinibacter arcticus]|uniref:Heparinase II/III-like protein n=1 Tax=Serinibacter arcticus TaxID=1655435 RepID=A0A2U1ZUM0_9MICO|nr:heparinase II/III family protein [Serinibacter arcticus]PWD50674.1 hypothetical protein C8046_08405 [Serinibacter arcticus]